MATHKVVNRQNVEVGSVELPDEAFGVEVKEHLLHEVVVAQLASRRAGTHRSKTRAEVSGGGKKPWRQKGTGRARSGSNTSPVWVRGGTAHGPKPRDYSWRPPRKVRKQAIAMAVSHKTQEGRLVVLDELDFERVKTKDFVTTLGALGLQNVLVVIPAAAEKLELSARNVPRTKVLRVEGLNVYDVLRYDHLVVTKDTVSRIAERVQL
ncbi:MAG: 50S ribosomal protein L4 [Myxococcales bacterium]|nr:50S ribosomal protein L4 [Myxococcales bacterium]